MRFFVRGLLTSSILFAVVPVAHADDATVLAQKFGAMPTIGTISLSPDGSKVAFTSVVKGGTVVFVADAVTGGMPKQILTARSQDGAIDGCQWVTNARVICKVRVVAKVDAKWVTGTRVLAVDADGSKLARLSADADINAYGVLQDGGDVLAIALPDRPGSVMMTHEFLPTVVTDTRLGRSTEGLGVDIVDSVTLKRTGVESAHENAIGFIADGNGALRIMATQGKNGDGYLRDTVHYAYRPLGSHGWQSLSSTTGNGATGFTPIAVDSTSNVVYGSEKLDGRDALYRFALDGSEKKELVLSRPDVDVDDLVTIGRAPRVVGASYATDRRTVDFFDPYLSKLAGALGKALPGQPLINIVDASDGENKLLLVAGGDTHPGMSYIYDKASHHLDEVLPIRADLDGLTLAEMKPVTFTAADGTKIPGYLTLPPGSTGKGLPAIVMPHGGPSARDEWGFDWLVQFFALRGFAVLQPNYRGSSGYGSAWFEKNGFQSWEIAMHDILDAGRWLEQQGIAAPGKLAIVGWSYGGYAALQTAMVDPTEFKAIVAVAPVTDLDQLKAERQDFADWNLVQREVGTGPYIDAGSPARHANRITAPVLLFHGDRDQNVSVNESRLMAGRLQSAGKSVNYTEFPGLDHQLESAEARTKLLSSSDAFLRKALGIQ